VSSVPATHPPALPLTLVLLALATLGVSTVLLSYRRTRSRVRHQPPHRAQRPRGQGSELVSVHDNNGQNGGSGR
jgi:hypothetical protein